MSYVSTVLADGPISYWKFNDRSGTAVADAAGTNTGAYVGSYSLGMAGAIPSDPTNASFFMAGAASGYADFGNILAFSGTAAFSLEIWTFPTGFGANRYLFWHRGIAAGSAYPGDGYFLSMVDANGQLQMRRYAAGASDACSSGTAAGHVLTLNAWNHVVGTYDGANMRIYLNATLVGGPVASTRAIPTENTWPFRIGNIGGSDPTNAGNNWIGFHDEAAVYGVALNQAQITNHYNAAPIPAGRSSMLLNGVGG